MKENDSYFRFGDWMNEGAMTELRYESLVEE